jgi:hypothetical protein
MTDDIQAGIGESRTKRIENRCCVHHIADAIELDDKYFTDVPVRRMSPPETLLNGDYDLDEVVMDKNS